MSTRFSNSITLDRSTLQFCATRSVDLRLFIPGITFWTDEDQRRALHSTTKAIIAHMRTLGDIVPTYFESWGGLLAYNVHRLCFTGQSFDVIDTVLYNLIAGKPFPSVPPFPTGVFHHPLPPKANPSNPHTPPSQHT